MDITLAFALVSSDGWHRIAKNWPDLGIVKVNYEPDQKRFLVRFMDNSGSFVDFTLTYCRGVWHCYCPDLLPDEYDHWFK